MRLNTHLTFKVAAFLNSVGNDTGWSEEVGTTEDGKNKLFGEVQRGEVDWNQAEGLSDRHVKGLRGRLEEGSAEEKALSGLGRLQDRARSDVVTLSLFCFLLNAAIVSLCLFQVFPASILIC